jgi:D-arabinan exo alpha-(1,3)/(1,5)-arabinofuranosidase (non-reducing end)
MRAYFGGSPQPTFLSSGLEDYFVSSGYFHHRRLFQTAISGLTHLDVEKNRFTAYRFHDHDPVFFQNGMRLTLRCGEELDGRVFHKAPAATYDVYTWVYQWA